MGKRSQSTKAAAGESLTPQQQKFCEHYALTGNGAESYAKAFKGSDKHDSQYRSEKASKLLAQAKIMAKVSRLRDKALEIVEQKFEITVERIAQEFAAIAFANSDDYVEWGSKEVEVVDKKTGEVKLDKNGKPVTRHVPYTIIKPSASLSKIQKKAVVGADMTVSKEGIPTVAIKMADKLAALKALGQHMEMFGAHKKITTEIDPSGKVTVVISSDEAKL